MRARRPADAEPQPGQLLRRDRAGRVPPRQRRARHRLHQRSAAAGAALLLPRHAADAARAVRTSTRSRSTARSRRSTTTSATATCGRRSTGARRATSRTRSAAAARCRRARRPAGSSRFPERIEGTKVRARSEKFFDHFSQATLFFQSQSEPEQDHIVEALPVRARQGRAPADPRSGWSGCSRGSTASWPGASAEGLGFRRDSRSSSRPLNQSIPGGRRPGGLSAPVVRRGRVESPGALSMANTVKDTSRPERSRFSPPTASTARRSTRMPGGAARRGRAARIRGARASARSKTDDGDCCPDRPQPADGGIGALRRRLRARRHGRASRPCSPIATRSTSWPRRTATASPSRLPPREPGSSRRVRGFFRIRRGTETAAMPSRMGCCVESSAADAAFVKAFISALGRHRFWDRSRRNRLGGIARGTRRDARPRAAASGAPPTGEAGVASVPKNAGPREAVGGSVWESNPPVPARGRDADGFEVREGHRTPCASAGEPITGV